MPKEFIWGPVGDEKHHARMDLQTPQVVFWAYLSAISVSGTPTPPVLSLGDIRYDKFLVTDTFALRYEAARTDAGGLQIIVF